MDENRIDPDLFFRLAAGAVNIFNQEFEDYWTGFKRAMIENAWRDEPKPTSWVPEEYTSEERKTDEHHEG